MTSIIIATPEQARHYDEELKREMQLTRAIINKGINYDDSGLITTPEYISNQNKIIQIVNALSNWHQSKPARIHKIREQMCENELILEALHQNLLVLSPDCLVNRDSIIKFIPMEILEMKEELLSLESN